MSEVRLLRELRGRLGDAGLTGSFLVRDLRTGAEIGLDPDRTFPIASLVKIPIAMTVLALVDSGELDPAAPVEVAPGRATGGSPAGLSQFRHPARVSVEDLLYLSIALSDSTATDALLAHASVAEVNETLRNAGVAGITVRHGLRELVETPADRLGPGDSHLAQAVAIGSQRPGLGRPIAQLDVTRTNSGSARAFADLLQALWQPTRVAPAAAARIRAFLVGNVSRPTSSPTPRPGPRRPARCSTCATRSAWSSTTTVVCWRWRRSPSRRCRPGTSPPPRR